MTPLNPLVLTLLERDGLSLDDAQAVFDEAQDLVRAGADPEEVLQDEFGLEPDYLYDLIGDL